MARNNVSCSDEQLEEFIENARAVLIWYNPITDDINGTTIAGIVRISLSVVLQYELECTH